MKLKDLMTAEVDELMKTVRNLTEHTLEQYENRGYYLLDHPDNSDDTQNVETIQDLIRFVYEFALAKGAKDKQDEICKVLGVRLA